MRLGSAMDGPTPRPSTSARHCVSIAPPAACSLPCWRSWSRSAGWVELGWARQRQQALAVDVLLEMVGQLGERGFDLALVTEARARGTDALQAVPALTVVGEQAVDVTASNLPNVVDFAFFAAVAETQER